MKASKFLVLLFIILLVTAAQVGAAPSSKQCAEISVVAAFAAPGYPHDPAVTNDLHGLTFDGEHLYCAVRGPIPNSTIYKMDMSGNVIDSFAGPGYVTGLAYKDGNIWAATDLQLTISELTTTGEVLQSFQAPGSDSTGLVFKHNALWNADWNWDDDEVAYLHRIKITKHKMIVKTYEAPGLTPAGLAFDGRNLWHVNQDPGKLYKLNPAAKVRCEYEIGDITGVAGSAPIGLTFDGTYLWMSMIDNGMIYQLDIGN